jgi:hypothetical protein
MTAIPSTMLHRVTHSFQKRLGECVDNKGRHLTDTIFRKWMLYLKCFEIRIILAINLRKKMVYLSFYFNLKFVRFFCRILYIVTIYLWELHISRKDTVWTKCGDFSVKRGGAYINHSARKVLRLNYVKLFIVPTEYTCGFRITHAKNGMFFLRNVQTAKNVIASVNTHLTSQSWFWGRSVFWGVVSWSFVLLS